MIIYRDKEITKIEEVAIKCACDICGSVIEDKTRYYYVTTGHNDWGNDSCDSREHYHICSLDCLKKKFEEYITETDGKQNSNYIEINHKMLFLGEKISDFGW